MWFRDRRRERDRDRESRQQRRQHRTHPRSREGSGSCVSTWSMMSPPHARLDKMVVSEIGEH